MSYWPILAAPCTHAVLYTRISDARDKATETQDFIANMWAKDNGVTWAGQFSDPDTSGYYYDFHQRDGFSKALALAIERNIPIVVSKFDRLTRAEVDWHNFVERYIQPKDRRKRKKIVPVRIIALDCREEVSTDGGLQWASQEIRSAQRERDKTSIRTCQKFALKRSLGQWTGHNIMWYERIVGVKPESKVVHDPDSVPVFAALMHLNNQKPPVPHWAWRGEVMAFSEAAHRFVKAKKVTAPQLYRAAKELKRRKGKAWDYWVKHFKSDVPFADDLYAVEEEEKDDEEDAAPAPPQTEALKQYAAENKRTTMSSVWAAAFAGG